MNIKCIACRQERLRKIRRYRTITKDGEKVFGGSWLYECLECGIVQIVPSPNPQAISDYYAWDYRRGGYRGDYHGSDVANIKEFPKDNLFYFNRGQSIVELVEPYVKKENPSILDIGAGFGHILHAFGQKYPKSNRLAIEYSEVCAQHLKSIGVKVYKQPVEEVLPQFDQKFDLIVLSHVFEHVLELPTILKLIQDCLVPGGILYIEVPNIPAESLLRYPDHIWAPRFDEPHVTFFSLLSLQNALTSSGFELKFCDTAGPEYKYISSIRFRLPPLRSFVQSLLPPPFFLWLRKQSFIKPLRVPERIESFYQYSGFRLWIRSVSVKRNE